MERDALELHFIHYNRDAFVVFDPVTRLFFRAGGAAAAILKRAAAGTDEAQIAAEEGVSQAFVRTVIDRVQTAISARLQAFAEKRSRRGDRTLGKLVLHVTSLCNMRCGYCYAGDGSYGLEKERMTPEFAVDVVERFYDYYDTISVIMFFGGEPLLGFPAIKAVCAYCGSRFQNGTISRVPAFGMVTNLSVLPDGFEELVREYSIGVTVSLDGPKEVNDAQRKFSRDGGTFDVVARNIHWLKASTGQPNMIESTYNRSHFDAGWSTDRLLDYFREQFGICSAEVAQVMAPEGHPARLPQGYGKKLAEEQDRAVSDTLDRLVEAHDAPSLNALKATLSLLLREEAAFDYHCTAGLEQFAVAANGDIYPCQLFVGEDKFRMGSSLDEGVFETEGFRAAQERLRANAKSRIEPCSTCWCRNVCLGCIARRHRETGSIRFPTPGECRHIQASVARLLVKLTALHGDRDRWAAFVNNFKRHVQVTEEIAPENLEKAR